MTIHLRIKNYKILTSKDREKILNRTVLFSSELISTVSEIINLIKKNGDDSLYKLTEKHDKLKLKDLRVNQSETAKAAERIPENLKESIKRAFDNIWEFHERGFNDGYYFKNSDGIKLGAHVVPYSRAGIYAPGGRASYPSTVLMGAIPALIAGVEEIILCTPASGNSELSNAVLYAAHLCGISEIYKIGGAQAIAAMAFGTKTIRPVEIITGPGNQYVAAAKKIVSDHVAIDFLAGPTEILVISDGSGNPEFIAYDMAAQAEHDPDAMCVFGSTDKQQLEKTSGYLRQIIPALDRKQIIEESLNKNGCLLHFDNIDDLFGFANEFAAEHLVICTKDPREDLYKIRNAGSVFLGEYSACAFGDYGVGPNHILPTSGFAKRSGALGVHTYQKIIPYQLVDKKSVLKIKDYTSRIANEEGLTCHRKSIEIRANANK